METQCATTLISPVFGWEITRSELSLMRNQGSQPSSCTLRVEPILDI
jgi:hypothetical protein